MGAILAVGAGLFILPLPGWWILLIALGVGGYKLAKAMFSDSSDLEPYRRRQDEAASRWSEASRAWNDRASPDRFDRKRSELEHLKRAWSGIPTLRLRNLEKLRTDQRRIQLSRFLDRFDIESATIPGIGPGRKQTLESYGIETADDVSGPRLAAVPGIGPVLSGNILAWRRSVASRFVFDQSKGIDPRDVSKVESDILDQKRKIELTLTEGLAELRQIHGQIVAARQQLEGPVEQAQRMHAQAVADLQAAGG